MIIPSYAPANDYHSRERERVWESEWVSDFMRRERVQKRNNQYKCYNSILEILNDDEESDVGMTLCAILSIWIFKGFEELFVNALIIRLALFLSQNGSGKNGVNFVRKNMMGGWVFEIFLISLY